jgi:DNA-directed RNA polymerase subunit K/omega
MPKKNNKSTPKSSKKKVFTKNNEDDEESWESSESEEYQSQVDDANEDDELQSGGEETESELDSDNDHPDIDPDDEKDYDKDDDGEYDPVDENEELEDPDKEPDIEDEQEEEAEEAAEEEEEGEAEIEGEVEGEAEGEEYTGDTKPCHMKNLDKDFIVLDEDDSNMYGKMEYKKIPDEDRDTDPIMTYYEMVRIIGTRAQQFNYDAPPLINGIDNLHPAQKAYIELMAKKTPFIIRRHLPGKKYEEWRVDELDIIHKITDDFFVPENFDINQFIGGPSGKSNEKVDIIEQDTELTSDSAKSKKSKSSSKTSKPKSSSKSSKKS